MSFIQIIETRTSDYDRVSPLEREWEAKTEGRRTARRSIVTRDRNDPDRYVIIVFFDSYESAMENSNLPETAELAAQMAEVVDSVAFQDLDIIEDREG